MGKIKIKSEERKQKLKPKKLFTISTLVYDDGVVSGMCIEYKDIGRLKNQKVIVMDEVEFIGSVRSILPSSIPAIEKVVQLIFTDINNHSADGCEKFAKVTVDLYSDGFIDGDFSEIQKGKRGAPKAWRLNPADFFRTIEARVGNLSSPFKALTTGNAVKTDGEIVVENK
jgi:hypothetical protein